MAAEINKNNTTTGNIEKNILSQNKIPGCDQLTRPEEIKALSKYLGNIKKVQEKHTTLQKDNLEVPGRTTGRIPKVSIPDHVEPLSESRNREKAKIYDESSRVKLEENHKPEKLNRGRVGLRTSEKETELSQRKEELEDDREVNLSNRREKLEGSTKEIELNKGKVSITDQRDSELRTHKESLEVPHGGVELPRVRESLEDSREMSLEDHRESLEDNRNISLGEYKESLKVTGETTLSNHRENLEDTREVNLGNVREPLKNTEETELKNYRESLSDQREVNLSSVREPLRKGEDVDLEDYRESLRNVPEDIDLEDYQDPLVDERDTRLSMIQEKLREAEEITSLSGIKEKLDYGDNLEINFLEDYKEELPLSSEGEVDSLGDSSPEALNFGNNLGPIDDLRGTTVGLEPEPGETTGLEDYVDPLTDERETELEDYRDPLDYGNNLEPTNDLRGTVVDLEPEPEETKELEDYQDPLDYGDNLEPVSELEDHVESLDYGDNLDPVDDLRGTVIDLEPEPEETTELEDYREELDYGDNLGDSDNFLEDHVEKLNPEPEETKELEDYIDSLIDERETELEDYRDPLDYGNNLEPTDDLRGTTIELEPEPEETGELEDYQEKLDYGDNLEEPSELGDYIDSLENIEEVDSLEDHIEKLEGTRESELGDNVEELPEHSDGPRSEGSVNYVDPREEGVELYDGALERPEVDSGVENYIDLSSGEEGIELYDGALERPEVDSGVENYIDLSSGEEDDITLRTGTVIKPAASQEAPRADGKYVHLRTDTGLNVVQTYIDPETGEETEERADSATTTDLEEIKQISELTGDEMYNKAMEFMERTESAEWEKKVQSLVSSYLSSSKISPDRALEFEMRLDKEIQIFKNAIDSTPINRTGVEKMPPMEKPDFSWSTFNVNDYLRYAAEKTVGAHDGELRETLIQETLSALVQARDLLERSTKSNRDRLPGDDLGLIGDLISSGVSGALDNLGSRLVNAGTAAFSSKPNLDTPINRPKSDEDEETTGWVAGNNRISQSDPGVANYSAFKEKEKKVHEEIRGGGESKGSSFLKKIGQTLKGALLGTSGGNENYSFGENYLRGVGIQTTIEELCTGTKALPNSVETLKKWLRESPYITSPNKFSSTKNSEFRIQTLDSDAYWELALEPYVGEANGGLNYLPGLHEINLRNIVQHGVNTAYNRWIPYTGFDLQKTKMTSKSLQLYDGEISYPVSMESLNEFRITIADDQYKSWRTYFEECAKASVYNSEGHDEEFYKNGEELTAIDTGNICIAMYKNITFRCRVYILTPQYSTIHKYDLLLVLKDFTEEHSGELDGGAGDLTVSFSIVGENPTEGFEFTTAPETAPQKENNTGKIVGSIIEHGINTAVKLL